MKFTVLQSDLAKFISYVGRIVDSKPSLPVLGNILIDAQTDKIILMATNLEITTHIKIPASVTEMGVTTVPARTFSEYILSLTDGTIELVKKGQVLSVTAGSSSAQFNTMNPDNFPQMPESKGDPEMVFNAGELKTAMELVTFSAGVDATSPVFTGVYLASCEEGVSFVSTDGYRLSRYTLKIKDKSQKLPWLIPVKALKEFLKFVAGSQSDNLVNFYLVSNSKQLLIEYKNIKMYTRLIEGEFPDYKAVIPTTHQTTVEMDFESFREVIKQVNIFARDIPGNKVLMTVNAKEKKVFFEATLAEVGSNKSTLTSNIEGNDLKIMFSAKQLSDFISNIQAEKIHFEGSTSESAGVFKIVGNDNYIHIIMPMTLGN